LRAYLEIFLSGSLALYKTQFAEKGYALVAKFRHLDHEAKGQETREGNERGKRA
jgi:hypothetical protein